MFEQDKIIDDWNMGSDKWFKRTDYAEFFPLLR